MTLDEARTILERCITDDGGLSEVVEEYVEFVPGNTAAILDGQFEADELEAIAVWMRHVNQQKGVQP